MSYIYIYDVIPLQEPSGWVFSNLHTSHQSAPDVQPSQSLEKTFWVSDGYFLVTSRLFKEFWNQQHEWMIETSQLENRKHMCLWKWKLQFHSLQALSNLKCIFCFGFHARIINFVILYTLQILHAVHNAYFSLKSLRIDCKNCFWTSIV